MDLRGLQQLKSFRLHKGATYYNLGLTRLLQEDPDAAHDYFVLATLEDASSTRIGRRDRLPPCSTPIGTARLSFVAWPSSHAAQGTIPRTDNT